MSEIETRTVTIMDKNGFIYNYYGELKDKDFDNDFFVIDQGDRVAYFRKDEVREVDK